jgi:hypothetical protein
MRRSVFVVLGLAGLAAGGTALAQGGDPYTQPEPKVHSRDVLRMASSAACDRNARVRVRFTPPAGAVFGWFEIEIRGRQAVRMTGVARAASATVALPRGRSTVRVRGETLGGQHVRAARVYRTCAVPEQAPAPPPDPVTVGGGED